MRRKLVAGNAKMNLGRESVRSLLAALRRALEERPLSCEVVYCPPFTLLPAASEVLSGSPVGLGAQDMHAAPEGAFTGEISAGMLLEWGSRYVILGHSERRARFHESDEVVRGKAAAALAAGLRPIVCVGESLAEREAGATEVVLTRQVVGSLSGLAPAGPDALVVAYEPVWAIGTGRNATPEQALAAHVHLRREIGRVLGGSISEGVRILYGGSVTPGNAGALLSLAEVDGALVGGASLKAESLLAIARAGEGASDPH